MAQPKIHHKTPKTSLGYKREPSELGSDIKMPEYSHVTKEVEDLVAEELDYLGQRTRDETYRT